MSSFGLIGEKLGHSFSKEIHGHLGEYNYELIEIPRDGLESFMDETTLNGFNVTIPYKRTIMGYCSHISNNARRIGAVNTVVRNEDGSFSGYNTDYFGMKVALEHGRINIKGKKCLILGSGGASATAQTLCEDLGAREIVVISRHGKDNYENLSKHFDGEIIINTTPVGMYPNNLVSLINLDDFKNCTGVFDLIYNPHRTKLILDAKKKNIPCCGGLYMLVAQAQAAAELFTGKKLDESKIANLYEEILLKTLNIVLIGMPGSGKTTFGRELSETLNRVFIDTDDSIVDHAGMCIPEIFQVHGESAFRKMETDILEQVCKESGQVISTGGGVVTKRINYNILKQNSRVIWVQRDLEKLAVAGRPLSMSMSVNEIYEEREPAYSNWSDEIYFNEEKE